MKRIFSIARRQNKAITFRRARPTFTVPEKSETLAEELKPKRDGELFVYLNKPVLGLWGLQNRGSAS